VSRKLWTATLLTSSPRYQDWHAILGSDEVPITNPKPFAVQLGPELTEGYSLDLARLDRMQVQRLLAFIVDRFGTKPREAQRVLESDGFPVRAADVTVCFELRAFL
jgi:hypothetical protein